MYSEYLPHVLEIHSYRFGFELNYFRSLMSGGIHIDYADGKNEVLPCQTGGRIMSKHHWC